MLSLIIPLILLLLGLALTLWLVHILYCAITKNSNRLSFVSINYWIIKNKRKTLHKALSEHKSGNLKSAKKAIENSFFLKVNTYDSFQIEKIHQHNLKSLEILAQIIENDIYARSILPPLEKAIIRRYEFLLALAELNYSVKKLNKKHIGSLKWAHEEFAKKKHELGLKLKENIKDIEILLKKLVTDNQTNDNTGSILIH
jgi:hypothetical protein